MLRDIAGIGDIMSGGMRAYEIDDKEIVLCNDGGTFYAFDRRCGHMNAPLDMGTANGCIVTCPLHSVQFDAKTGMALSYPVPDGGGDEPLPKGLVGMFTWLPKLMEHVKTHDIKTYLVVIKGDRIQVDL